MKLRGLTLPSVLACLFLAVAAVLPSQPWSSSRSSPYTFEIRAESDEPGLVQLYYDIGRGTNEADSVREPIVAGRPEILRFALPYGSYKFLRFDPLDREARMTFSGARIVDGSGRTFSAFAPSHFQAAYEIRKMVPKEDSFSIETVPGATDPRMVITLDSPFTIPLPPVWREIAAAFAVIMVSFVLIEWAWVHRGIRLGARGKAAWTKSNEASRRRPRLGRPRGHGRRQLPDHLRRQELRLAKSGGGPSLWPNAVAPRATERRGRRSAQGRRRRASVAPPAPVDDRAPGRLP